MAELTREEGWLVRGGEDAPYTELCWSKEEVRAALKILLEEDFEHYFARFNDPDEWAGNEIMWRDWEIGYVAITKFTALRALSAPAPQQASTGAEHVLLEFLRISVIARGDIPMPVREAAILLYDKYTTGERP